MGELLVEDLDRIEIAILDVDESDDHIRDLNARVVDVVLHLDPAAGRFQDSLE